MWPFNRKKKISSKRQFAGAGFSRLTSDWMSHPTSQDAELLTSLPALRNRSRELGRNNDYVRSFFRTLQNNVVGQGIPFQSKVQLQRGGKLDDVTNKKIQAAWQKWTRAENCHVAGKNCFEDIERLVVRTLAESGEFIVRMIRQPMGSSKVPLSLELIEADRLDVAYNRLAPDTGNEIRMGVEVNQWGRPVAYYFFSRMPNDVNTGALANRSGTVRIRVPAAEVIHGFIPDRMNQTRGVPWLASAMIRLHHMQGYEEAEVIAARASSSLMGFIQSPEAETSLKDDVQDSQSVSEFEPGVFKKLNPGETMNVPSLSRPGGQFDPFMRAMIRGVAAGTGASYESISRDYSQSNYSSSRLALLEDRDNWRSIQWWLISNFHQKIYEQWLDLAVLSGEVQLKNYELNPDQFYNVKWKPRGWSWVDPAKEVDAYRDAVRSGFMTLGDVVAITSPSGEDLEQVLVERADEIKTATELGLIFDTDAAQVNKMGANQKNPIPEEDPAGSGQGAAPAPAK